MTRTRFVLLMALLMVVAVSATLVAQPSAQSATVAKKEAVLQFGIATGDPDFDLLRVVPIIRSAAKIGSPDPDGFAIDSFFDIEYRIDYSTSTPTHTLDVEIHAAPNSPDVNPAAVIDRVTKALGKGVPTKHELTGHVMLIK